MTGSMDSDADVAGPAVSGFGGHPLSAVQYVGAAADGDSAVNRLAALGIDDADQLVAASSVPGITQELQDALDVDDGTFQALLDVAVGELPADRAALVGQPTSVDDLHLGVRQPTPEMLAEAAESAAVALAPAVALPASVNLIGFLPPIRNQASRGTCVAFTLTALNEYVLRRRGIVRDLSEQHLYYEVKLIDGAPNGCGTWQSKAVLALRDRGQCRESVWPYNPNPPCNNHGARPLQARPDGLNNKLATLAVSTRSVAAYKAQLALQRPVTLSIPVYNSWYQSAETRRSGRITMRIGAEQSVGGHAICIVGYQDSASSPGGGYFIIRNSWSTNWAYQSPYGAGYGTIPYQYITNDAWEAYTAVVPGVGESPEDLGDHEQSSAQSSVTIDVGPNIKITIESR